jgi:hypothetical protein
MDILYTILDILPGTVCQVTNMAKFLSMDHARGKLMA